LAGIGFEIGIGIEIVFYDHDPDPDADPDSGYHFEMPPPLQGPAPMMAFSADLPCFSVDKTEEAI
jgi:hypothetical protein